MFWKSATVLQTWHWEVLTIFRKATQTALLITRKHGSKPEKCNYHFQRRPRPYMY